MMEVCTVTNTTSTRATRVSFRDYSALSSSINGTESVKNAQFFLIVFELALSGRHTTSSLRSQLDPPTLQGLTQLETSDRLMQDIQQQVHNNRNLRNEDTMMSAVDHIEQEQVQDGRGNESQLDTMSAVDRIEQQVKDAYGSSRSWIPRVREP